MSTNFAIIGGDLRIIQLAKILAKEKNKVYTYGLEKAEELKNVENIIFCETTNQAIQNSEIIIGPIPFSSNGKNINTPFSEMPITIQELLNGCKNKMIIAGAIQLEKYELMNQQEWQIVDIMKREEVAVLNAISTAEGAIQIAIQHTRKNIQGSKVLILGFGRIGKILAKKMEGLSANVTCVARKQEDLAWIRAYGYRASNINTLGKELAEYDIIINTVPQLVLTAERLQYVDKETLLIDLASKPGGMDEETINAKNLKFIWALALPGKVSPITTAEIIKDTIYQILKEKKEKC